MSDVAAAAGKRVGVVGNGAFPAPTGRSREGLREVVQSAMVTTHLLAE